MGKESDSEEVVRNERERDKERGRDRVAKAKTQCEKHNTFSLLPLPCQED